MDKPSAPSRSMISSAVASTKSRVILPSRCASTCWTVRSAGGRVIATAPSLIRWGPIMIDLLVDLRCRHYLSGSVDRRAACGFETMSKGHLDSERTVVTAFRKGVTTGSPRARTYSGQRRCGRHRLWAFAQVRGLVEMQAGACCKTVGSAYVGSNPTPATPAETAPGLRKSGPAGRFWSRRVSGCVTAGRCMAVSTYIADSVRAERTVRMTARFADSRPFCPVTPGCRTARLADVPDIPADCPVTGDPKPAWLWFSGTGAAPTAGPGLDRR